MGRGDRAGKVVAVTGARGFVGGEVLKRLEEDPRVETVLALDIVRPRAYLDKTTYHKLDLTLPTVDSDLVDILGEAKVDTMVHAAFLSHPIHNSSWAHELEEIGTMHVLNACAETKVKKFVLSSTTMVYGASPVNPNFLSEKHPLRGNPTSRYVTDRVGAEKLVENYREENKDCVVTTLRVAPTLGPTVNNYVTRFFSRPVAPIMMGYDPLMQFVHEHDVSDAFQLALDGDYPGNFNITGDGVLPYSTILAMMGKFPLPLPHFLARSLANALWATQIADAPPNFLDFLRYVCVTDGSKAKKVMGFVPRYAAKEIVQDFLGLRDAPSSPSGDSQGPHAHE